MRTRRLRITIGLFLVLGLIATACSSRSSDSGSGGTSAGGDASGPAATDNCTSYDGSVGVSDTEIKVGSSFPQSGPFATLAQIPAGYDAYFEQLNSDGGIDGHDIKVDKLDDAYDPSQTISNYEKLANNVFTLFSMVGTKNNLAIQAQQNKDCVPNLFAATGSPEWGNPAEFPWTIGLIPTYPTESAAFAEYLKKNKDDAKVGFLFQNDEFGKAYLNGFENAIKGTDITIVKTEPVEPNGDPKAQVNSLQDSGADTLFIATTGLPCINTFGAKESAGWDPLVYVSATCSAGALINVVESSSKGAANGAVTSAYIKDPANPQWDDDEGMKQFKAAAEAAGMEDSVVKGGLATYGYLAADLLAYVLKNAAGLTRVDVMNESWEMKKVELGLLLPGITINTNGEDDPYPVEQLQLAEYDSDKGYFELTGDLEDFTGKTAKLG